MVEHMNLYLDNCRPAVFAARWIPGRTLAIVDMVRYPTTQDYLYMGLSDKARQHYNKSIRLGYTCSVDDYDYRNDHIDDIYKINTSMSDRQGRPMDESYHHPNKFEACKFCEHHHFVLLLIIQNDTIVAYMEFYIVGQFAQTSRVLGHADHLRNGVMVQLFTRAVDICRDYGVLYFCYGEWQSGTDGLKFFKKSTGFVPLTLM